ncbi:hypothetical protein ACFVWS_38150, partial [Streptomyces sp. NPDC058204]|uniref:hypothetical protein n=1 Tax=Streptomyces sp. NPDC058204 TaxID=3346381 RepID=UPI0036E95599
MLWCLPWFLECADSLEWLLSTPSESPYPARVPGSSFSREVSQAPSVVSDVTDDFLAAAMDEDFPGSSFSREVSQAPSVVSDVTDDFLAAAMDEDF